KCDSFSAMTAASPSTTMRPGETRARENGIVPATKPGPDSANFRQLPPRGTSRTNVPSSAINISWNGEPLSIRLAPDAKRRSSAREDSNSSSARRNVVGERQRRERVEDVGGEHDLGFSVVSRETQAFRVSLSAQVAGSTRMLACRDHLHSYTT